MDKAPSKMAPMVTQAQWEADLPHSNWVTLFFFAKQKDTPEYKKTLQYLTKNINHRETNYPYYWEYYMSQALFHANEELLGTME